MRDRLVPKLDADNLCGICDADKNMPTLGIGESGKRFNRCLIEGGFELDRFGLAFCYEIRDGFFVHFLFFNGVLMRLTWPESERVRSLNSAFCIIEHLQYGISEDEKIIQMFP